MWPTYLQFRCLSNDGSDTIPALRWKRGNLYGLSLNGESGHDKEYLYVHLQKRAMTVPPGLEKEDSFMINPNEFVRDHELTQEEITSFITPNPEYERAMRVKYSWGIRKTPLQWLRSFFASDFAYKRLRLKGLMNKIFGRKLASMWEEKGVRPTYLA